MSRFKIISGILFIIIITIVVIITIQILINDEYIIVAQQGSGVPFIDIQKVTYQTYQGYSSEDDTMSIGLKIN
ncbi:MAG: hypothetical protein AB7P56_07365 [Nitrososphaeraceae archaeon]